MPDDPAPLAPERYLLLVPNLDGGAGVEGFEEAFALDDLRLRVTRDEGVLGGNPVIRTPILDDVVVNLAAIEGDVAALQLALIGGRQFPEASVVGLASGPDGPVEALRLDFEDVLLTGSSTRGGEGGLDRAFGLIFSTVEVTDAEGRRTTYDAAREGTREGVEGAALPEASAGESPAGGGLRYVLGLPGSGLEPIEVDGFSFGFANSSTTLLGPGSGAGKTSVQDLRVRGELDAVSAPLVGLAASGRLLPDGATLDVIAPGGGPRGETACWRATTTSVCW